MKHLLPIFSLCLFLAGCSGEGADTQVDTPTIEETSAVRSSPEPAAELESTNESEIVESPANADSPGDDGSQLTPVPVDSGALALSPSNSTIEFIGTHVGDRPDPRTGGFERFSGEIQVDAAAGAPTSIKVEIETDSLWTQMSKLTNHLKSVDFFEVREYPTATFQSTSITAADAVNGEYLVTGDLTLHGVTKEVRFPANVSISDDGFVLRSSFTLDRMEFDIAYDPGRVETDVSLTVVVGEPTQPQQAQGGRGGRGGRRRGDGAG